jgi:dihydrofolate synthase/folylpolyglutamate synthase
MELNLAAIKNAFCYIKPLNPSFVLHIIGTNGKGSTGRYIASYLHDLNRKTAHYSSPHIVNFNERIWINGEDIKNHTLDKYHNKLLEILPKKISLSLSYFEYTTILAFYIFKQKKIEFWIIEAGLGGEFDATNVIKKSLSLITPIGLDHEEFLGSSIDDIATTKINSISNDAIIHIDQKKEVVKIANTHLNSLEKKLFCISDLLNPNQINQIKNLNIPIFLKQNLLLSVSALAYMKIEDIDITKFLNYKLKARCQRVSQNITLDVGHNELAALEIKKIFDNKKIILVYNCLRDKKYKKILDILKPVIKKLEIIEIKTDRAIETRLLKSYCKKIGIETSIHKKIDKNQEYLFFGSFFVVEKYFSIYC